MLHSDDWEAPGATQPLPGGLALTATLDILKAIALGATATMGGRAHLYGLGAAGERGVDTAIGFLRAELHRAMALNGAWEPSGRLSRTL